MANQQQSIDANRMERAHHSNYHHEKHATGAAQTVKTVYDDSGKPLGLSAPAVTSLMSADMAAANTGALTAIIQSKLGQSPMVPGARPIGNPMATLPPQQMTPMASAAAPTQMAPATSSSVPAPQFSAAEVFGKHKDKLIKVPFSLNITASMADLAAGKTEPHFVFDLSKNVPGGLHAGQSVLIAGINIEHKSSSANLPIGMSFGSLGGKMTHSLPGQRDGATFHTNLPINSNISMQQAPENVFSASSMTIAPEHLFRYGYYKTSEQIRADIQFNAVEGKAYVPEYHPIGEVMRLPNAQYQNMKNADFFKAVLKPTSSGQNFYTMDATTCESVLAAIEENVLKNPEFHERQTRLDEMAITISPLTASQKFIAPELLVETDLKQRKENNRLFQIQVSGYMEVVPLPVPQKVASAIAK